MLYLGVLLVTAAVVLFLFQPVMKGIHASLDREDDELTETEARKRIALLALRDVEYDFLAGKLDEEDYRTMKARLTAEALDALEADETSRGESAHDDSLEAEIGAIRRELQSSTPCSGCSFLNPEGSRFCSSCGAQLVETAVR